MISFFAAGTPQTKGSARAFVVNGQAIITNDNPKAKTWAGVIASAAHEAMAGRPLLDQPLEVQLRFELARPQSHFGAKGLKSNAPNYCDRKPDIDKLARCCLDALTGVVITDDARIASLSVEKRYTRSGTTGVHILVSSLELQPALFTPTSQHVEDQNGVSGRVP